MRLSVMLCGGGQMPTRGTEQSAGWDLYSPISRSIDPLSRTLLSLGIKTAFTAGFVGLILDRSGMGNKGITRFAGVIDSDFRGEWGVILYNSTHESFRIAAGDRVAQVVFLELPSVISEQVFELPASERDGGFGSTGK